MGPHEQYRKEGKEGVKGGKEGKEGQERKFENVGRTEGRKLASGDSASMARFILTTSAFSTSEINQTSNQSETIVRLAAPVLTVLVLFFELVLTPHRVRIWQYQIFRQGG